MKHPLPTIGLLIADVADRRLLEAFLQQSGYKVCVATSAQPYFEHWERVSLILADEQAVRYCGRTLLTMKRRAGAVLLPLLILLPHKADGVAWLKAGFDDVLRQPLTKAELIARLNVFLRLREQTEEQYQALFENALLGMYRMTAADRVLVANPAFAQMLGYPTPDELMAQPPTQIALRKAPARADFLQQLERDGQVAGLETIWTRQDGSTLFACESARVVYDEAGQFLYYEGTIEDITKRKQAEEELRQTLLREREMKEALAVANRTKDEFLAMVSHELRTPLHAMLGWARLLRGGTLNPASAAHAIEVIESNAQAQGRLIEDLLDISRITTGKLQLNIGPLEPTTVVQAALDTVRPAAEVKGVRLTAHFAPEVGLITGDPDRLQQIIWNLLANAVKFTPKGGEVEVRLRRANSQLEIVVSDTGQGINPEFLPYVFERFRQADSTLTRAHGGLGLGLSIARHLVEMHGGTISAESEGTGQGTKFIVRLPLVPVRWEAPPVPQEVLSQSPCVAPKGLPRLNNMRVLVVDDEPNTCEIITTLLAEYGAEVRSCFSAAEARQILATWLPDVLISDISMPGEDGYEFMRQLRATAATRASQLPAVALTAYARRADRMKALRAGFQMHVAKPADPTELVTVIASLTQHLEKPPDSGVTP